MPCGQEGREVGGRRSEIGYQMSEDGKGQMSEVKNAGMLG